MSLLDLPLELFLNIAAQLDTRSYVRLASTSKAVRITLQGERLAALVEHGVKRHPKRFAIIRLSSRLILSHALIYIVSQCGYSRAYVQPFVNAGASFGRAPSDDFVKHCIFKQYHPGRLIFAIRHDALDGVNACRVRKYLKYAIVFRGVDGGHVRAILPKTSDEDLTWVMDQLITEAGNRPYFWNYIDFLRRKDARLSEQAKEVVAAQMRYLMCSPIDVGGKPMKRKDISALSLLQKMRSPIDPRVLKINFPVLLPFAISLAQLSGGINGLLDMALSHWADASLALNLMEHGAVLEAVPGGVESLPERVLNCIAPACQRVKAIELLMEHGISLDQTTHGYTRHLKNLFLLHGPGAEVRQFERDRDISLGMIQGGLDELLAECIFEPDEPGMRVDFLMECGATLADHPKLNEYVKRAFTEHGPGPKLDLLSMMGGRIEYKPGLAYFLEITFYRYGEGPRVDWLKKQGAVMPPAHMLDRHGTTGPKENALQDYQMQLMLLERQNQRMRLSVRHQRSGYTVQVGVAATPQAPNS